MGPIGRFGLSSSLALACLVATPMWAHPSALTVGDKVPSLEFKDVWYLPRSLADFGDKRAIVLVFTATECAATNAFLDELKRLDEAYRAQGVQIVSINASAKDSIRRMAHHALEAEFPFPSVKDLELRWTTALGIESTPTAALVDAQGVLRYRGRIDDRRERSDGRPTTSELVDAIDAVLAGRSVAAAETKAVGSPVQRATDVDGGRPVTYSEHVQPILREHCCDCHRPGTEAPFSLVGYENASSHAEMIAEVVAEERMPPWYASHGEWANARGMSPGEIAVVRRWAASGAPAGGRVAAEAPVESKGDGWEIQEPDLVITMTGKHVLPADGYVPYKYKILPHVFEHDVWVQEIEIKPSNPRVVHHCNMAYIAPGKTNWLEANFVTGKVPGVQPMTLMKNLGFRIPKGSRLLLQIHYTTTGKPEECVLSVGMRYAREIVEKEFRYLWMVNNSFRIPPGDGFHRVVGTNRLACDAVGIGLFAHMHLRGRDMSFFALYPDGRREALLVIPNYSFDWQMGYAWPYQKTRFPKGTVIEAVSHYDNSPFNPYNPDPGKEVTEGQQTFDEMLNGVMFYYDENERLGLRIDPANGKVLESGVAVAADDSSR